MEKINKRKKIVKMSIILAIILILVGILLALIINSNTKEEIFNVTFVVDGVEYHDNVWVVNGSISPLPSNPTKEGYVFDYWEIDGKKYTGNEKITSDVTLVAVFREKEKVIVTFNKDNGEKGSTKTIYKYEKVTAISPPKKTGYEFIGWYLDVDDEYGEDELFSFDTKVEENITLIAKWEPLVYIITFDSNGGSNVGSKVVDYKNKVKVPNEPTREGYNFLGWYLNDKKYDFNTKVTKDITLVAKWESKIPTELAKPQMEITGSPFNRKNLKETMIIQCEYNIKLTNYKDYIYQAENGEYKYFIDEYYIIKDGTTYMIQDDIEETLKMLLDFGGTYEIYLKVVRKNSDGEIVASNISDSIIIDTKSDMTPKLTLGVFKCSSSWDFCEVLLEDGLYKYRLNVFGSVGENFDGGIIEIYEKENGNYTYIDNAGHESGLFVEIAPNTKKTYVARACLTNSLSQKMCGNYSNELIIDTSKENGMSK